MSIHEILTSPVVMLLCGLGTHFLVELVRILKENEDANLINYLFGSERNRAQTALCVIGAVVGYTALSQSGDLSGITAFGVGYMSNTVPDILGKRTTGKLER